MEGIKMAGSYFYVIKESGNVMKIDRQGRILQTYRLSDTSRLEGITFDSDRDCFYLVHEKKPEMLLAYNTDFVECQRHLLTGAKDFSGLAFDNKRKGIWMVSHESATLLFWNLKNQKYLYSHRLDIHQAEGVAIDLNEKRIYIIGDMDEELFVFDLPSEAIERL